MRAGRVVGRLWITALTTLWAARGRADTLAHSPAPAALKSTDRAHVEVSKPFPFVAASNRDRSAGVNRIRSVFVRRSLGAFFGRPLAFAVMDIK